MAWNRGKQGVTPKKPRKRPHKTKKRLAKKAEMLKARAAKKRKRS